MRNPTHPTPWLTIRDAHDGIETFLLDGPKGMSEICKMAREYGSTDFDTAGFVRALVASERFRLNEGNVENHTLARLDSFVDATAGKRIIAVMPIRIVPQSIALGCH